MKLVVLLLLLLSISFVVAKNETMNRTPQIITNFTAGENVYFSNISLLRSTGAIPITYNGSRGTTQLPAILNTTLFDILRAVTNNFPLENRVFRFFINVTDNSTLRNPAAFSFTFNVSAPGQVLELQQPVFGGFNKSDINVSIGSQLPSQCRWIQNDNPITFPLTFLTMTPLSVDATGRVHTINNLFATLGITPTQGTAANISVTCNETGTLTPSVWTIKYLQTRPNLTIALTPSTIVNPAQPNTQVSVSADQDIWCTIADKGTIPGPNNIFGLQTYETYANPIQGVLNVPYPASSFNIKVRCQNRAGLEQNITTTVGVNYEAPIVINILTAPAYNTRAFRLNFTTSASAWCTAARNGVSIPLNKNAPATNPADQFYRDESFNSDGIRTYNISCSTVSLVNTTNISFSVSVDSTPPTFQGIVMAPLSCGLTQVTFTFNTTETPPSAIALYNYTITNGTAWSVSGSQATPVVIHANLNLANNTQYTVTGQVADSGGNIAGPSSASFKATTNQAAGCDLVAPTTAHLVTETANGTLVRILCSDDVACKNEYRFKATTGASQACNVTVTDTPTYPLGFNHTLLQSSTICWLVSDTADNFVIGGPVFVNSSKNQDITLLAPSMGGMDDIANDVTIGTNYAATCRYTTDGSLATTMTQFTSVFFKQFSAVANGNKTHAITDFYNTIGITPTENQAVDFGVTCLDNNGFFTKRFTITYITNEPTFTISASPIPIIDLSSPRTQLNIQSSQDVWCTVDTDELFGPASPAAYKKNQQALYDDVRGPLGEASYPISVTCSNRAGLSTTKDFNITSNYSSIVGISFNSQRMTTSSAYPLAFTTTKLATCTASVEGTNVALPSVTATSFSASTTLKEGTNTFTIDCETPAPKKETSLDVDVILDSKSPTLSIAAPNATCSATELTFTLSGQDQGTGVDSFEYSITEGSNALKTAMPTQQADNKQTLTLTVGREYTISALAIDQAGNRGASVSAKTLVVTGADSRCDRKPPTIAVSRSASNVITVTCTDENGCADAYYCSVVPAQASCVADKSNVTNKYSFTAALKPSADNTKAVCCEASDVAGNTNTKSLTATNVSTPAPPPFAPPPNLCINNRLDAINFETDVDCGGFICAGEAAKKCANGKMCVANADCMGAWCDGDICKASGCNDSVKNGAETGVDCGGTCGACNQQNSACRSQADCSSGLVCTRGVCANRGELEDPDPEEPVPTQAQGSVLSLVFIILGSLLVMGGVGTLALYAPPKKMAPTVEDAPIASFEETALAQEPAQQQTKSAETKKRAGPGKKQRRQRIVSEFETPEDLSHLKNINHKHLESAYEKFKEKDFKETTKQLIDDGKIEKKDVAIAIADLASNDKIDDDAIEDLKKEFGIEDEK